MQVIVLIADLMTRQPSARPSAAEAYRWGHRKTTFLSAPAQSRDLLPGQSLPHYPVPYVSLWQHTVPLFNHRIHCYPG